METWADSSEQNGIFHPVAAFVDGQLVGASAMLSLQVTVPGENQVPLGGVTATGVIATHRRRGLLRGMMKAMFDAALERGEPTSMLSASEGSIYGRFGFSPATYRTRWEIERSEAGLLTEDGRSGSVELIEAAAARAAWPALHELIRFSRVGELSAPPGTWSRLSDTASGTDGPLRYLVHRDDDGVVDGIANFRLPWARTSEDAGTLIVEAIQGANPHAYRALWEILLDFDLTRKLLLLPVPATNRFAGCSRTPGQCGSRGSPTTCGCASSTFLRPWKPVPMLPRRISSSPSRPMNYSPPTPAPGAWRPTLQVKPPAFAPTPRLSSHSTFKLWARFI